MATADKPSRRPKSKSARKREAAAPAPPPAAPIEAADPKTEKNVIGERVLRLFDRIYGFLASLKLAVITLSLLSACLAYATFYESWYGTSAVQDDIYRSPGFAILLAFLGANILCAALIRYPWTKRQTGFVVTHAGLLTVLAGSWAFLLFAKEGQLSLAEGEKGRDAVRVDAPVFVVQQIDPKTNQPLVDPKTGQTTPSYQFPFRPSSATWTPSEPDLTRLLTAAVFHPGLRSIPAAIAGLAHTVAPAQIPWNPNHSEVLTSSDLPFRLAVKSYLSSSMPRVVHEAGPGGRPMLKLGARIKAPNMPAPMPLFQDEEDAWFVVDRFDQEVKNVGPAELIFLHIDDPEKFKDFLDIPKELGPAGFARIHYTDSAGKPRSYDWPIKPEDEDKGIAVTLPDSDIKATFVKVFDGAEGGRQLVEMLGRNSILGAEFNIRKGSGEGQIHYGWASLPGFPSFIPSQEPGHQGESKIWISYVQPSTNGQFGVIEVATGPDDVLAYRVFDRKGLKSLGRLKKGEDIQAFGGGENQPMSLSFRVEEYFHSGVRRLEYVPLKLPKEEINNAVPAALIEVSAGGASEEVWIRRSHDLTPRYQKVTLSNGQVFDVTYDFDRFEIPFTIKLIDFEVGFDPGTQQASSYKSDVEVSDPGRNLIDHPTTISMNRPLQNRAWTAYQASFEKVRDPETRQPTGQYKSVFQMRYDPVWRIVYFGCLLVVLGAFLQFYMRAGVFTTARRRAGPATAKSPVRTDPLAELL